MVDAFLENHFGEVWSKVDCLDYVNYRVGFASIMCQVAIQVIRFII